MKFICYFTMIAMMVLAFDRISGDELSSGTYPPDIQRIKDRGKLIVAQYQGERPLFFMWMSDKTQVPDSDTYTHRLPDNRRIGGLDIWAAKFLANRLHVELELDKSYKSYDDVVIAVSNGKADIGISKLVPGYERLQLVRFSHPCQIFSVALLVNRKFLLHNELRFNSKSQYEEFDSAFNRKTVRIGVQTKSAAGEMSKVMYPAAEVINFTHLEEAVIAAKNNEIDAVLSDDFDFLFLELFDPEINVYCSLLRVPDTPYKVCMAVPPASVNLLGLADEVADSIKNRDASSTIKKYGRLMKTIETDMYGNPDEHVEKKYPFNSIYGKKKRSLGFGYDEAVSVAATGFLFVIVAGIWMLMGRPRKKGVK